MGVGVAPERPVIRYQLAIDRAKRTAAHSAWTSIYGAERGDTTRRIAEYKRGGDDRCGGLTQICIARGQRRDWSASDVAAHLVCYFGRDGSASGGSASVEAYHVADVSDAQKVHSGTHI
jgi:hypothetical protein